VGGGAVGGKWRVRYGEVEERRWSTIIIEVATTGKQNDRANSG